MSLFRRKQKQEITKEQEVIKEQVETSKIDALVTEYEQLKIFKQKIDDERKQRNKVIDAEINRLMDEGALIKEEADSKIAEINRKLAKLKKQIILEKDYHNSVVESLTKMED